MSSSIEKYKTKPYAHQLKCLQEYGKKEYFALLADMGTGKTFIIINNIAELWADDEVNGVLVLAPNGVQTNWMNIELGKPVKGSYFEIFNSQGQFIRKFPVDEISEEIYVGDLAAGAYFYKLTSKNEVLNSGTFIVTK